MRAPTKNHYNQGSIVADWDEQMKIKFPVGGLTLGRVMRKLNHHRTTEVYFVGYPKTGNTWLRYMLGRYVQLLCDLPDLPLFDATDRMGRCEIYSAGPAMQFTHRPLVWHDQAATNLDYEKVIRPFQKKRVVLLARHPLDALVSLWLQRKHRTRTPYEGDLLDFLENPVLGLEKFLRFYSLWFHNRERVCDFFLLRYEDLRASPERAFAGLLEYLNLPHREEHLVRAVADSDFESMKKIELAGGGPKYSSSGLDVFATGELNNPEALHVRRGKVGGYREYLQEQDIVRLMDSIDQNLPSFFGYFLSQNDRILAGGGAEGAAQGNSR
jgi:hypothetical protein